MSKWKNVVLWIYFYPLANQHKKLIQQVLPYQIFNISLFLIRFWVDHFYFSRATLLQNSSLTTYNILPILKQCYIIFPSQSILSVPFSVPNAQMEFAWLTPHLFQHNSHTILCQINCHMYFYIHLILRLLFLPHKTSIFIITYFPMKLLVFYNPVTILKTGG